MNIKHLVVGLLFPVSLFSNAVQDDQLEHKDLDSQRVIDIVKSIDERDEGKTSKSNMVMVLEDKRGNRRVRNLQSYGKVYEDREAMSIYFLSPSEVKGSAFLSVDHNDRSMEDDAWLYLPALNRTRRVAQTSQSDSFMGSDFSYSDISGSEIWDWEYSIESESEQVDGFDCWLLKAVPAKGMEKKVLDETGYTEKKIWVRKDNYYVVRGQFFVKKGKKVKYMKADGVSKVDDIWSAEKITMVTTKNEKVQHKSIIQFSNRIFNSDIPDKRFSTSALAQEL